METKKKFEKNIFTEVIEDKSQKNENNENKTNNNESKDNKNNEKEIIEENKDKKI